MHEPVRDYVRAHLPPDLGVVLEIGSRDINGGVRDLLDSAVDYTGFDLIAGPGVDEVADFAGVFWKGDPVDLILCLEVLEHAENWRELIASASRNLREGGLLLVTCATTGRGEHSGITGAGRLEPGEHYANVTALELGEALLAAGFQTFATEVLGVDLRAWAIK